MDNSAFMVVAVGGGICVAIVSVIGSFVRDISRNKERENSRREIAAYVAEGSMTAEEGERLLNAGGKKQA